MGPIFDSQKNIAKAAADDGASVIISNHSEYDEAYTKARLVGLKREEGEEIPSLSERTKTSAISR